MKDKIYLESNGNKLYGLLEGPEPEGRKIPLVLIMHGYMTHSRMHPFYDLVRALWKEGFATLRFDFNGHGRSEGELKDMTMSKNIADGECFFQYAKSLDLFDEIIPLGYSMGALVAGRLAVAHQEEVKRFVMMSPAANIQTRAVSGNYFGERFDPDNLPDVLVGTEIVLGKAFIEEAKQFDVFHFLEDYNGDVLLVFGEEDKNVESVQTYKYRDVIRNLTFVPVSDEAHYWGKHGDVAVEVIRDFLVKGNERDQR